MLKLLLSSAQYTISKLYNSLKSLGYEVGKSTIQTFIGYTETAYFLYSVPILSPKVKDQMQCPRKVYFVDNGFIRQLSSKFSRNIGRLYENESFLELKRRQANDPELEIFYWKNMQHEEIDFVIKHGLRIKQLIQVCYDIQDYETKKRELKSLLKGAKELKCKNLLVITEDKEGEEKIKGMKIKYIPMWKWLLQS